MVFSVDRTSLDAEHSGAAQVGREQARRVCLPMPGAITGEPLPMPEQLHYLELQRPDGPSCGAGKPVCHHVAIRGTRVVAVDDELILWAVGMEENALCRIWRERGLSAQPVPSDRSGTGDGSFSGWRSHGSTIQRDSRRSAEIAQEIRGEIARQSEGLSLTSIQDGSFEHEVFCLSCDMAASRGELVRTAALLMETIALADIAAERSASAQAEKPAD